MTTPKINLTELRAFIEEVDRDSEEWRFENLDPDTLYALIDTAETAIDLFDDQPEIQADYPQLHETLNQYARTPPNE